MITDKIEAVPKRGKLSFLQKTSWALGSGASTIMANSHGYLAMPIYQIALGVDPILLGMAMGIPRLIDALTDPIMGYISDNTRSRFGRRRPYILIGAILSAILFFFMWSPPSFLGTDSIALYFLLISILYYVAYTVFVIPWGALGFELTRDYNERTNVQAYNMFIQAVFGLSLGFMWKLSMMFGKNEIEGVRVVGLVFGGVILITGIMPAIFGREKIAVQTQEKISFTVSIKETVKNGPFMKLCAVTLLMFLGIFMVNPFAAYININYVFGPENENTTIRSIDKMRQVIIDQGSDKIIDAVVTQWAGEKIRSEAYERSKRITNKFSFDPISLNNFDVVPQDVSRITKDFTDDDLAQTVKYIITKNLKDNIAFYGIKKMFSASEVEELLSEIDSISIRGIEDVGDEIRDTIAQTRNIVASIAVADEQQVKTAMQRYPQETLEGIMLTSSYVISKDQVSTFNIWGNVAFQAVMLITIPAVAGLASRFGKKVVYTGGLAIVLLGFLSSWFSYNPQIPYLQCLTLASLGGGLAVIFTLGQSMVADVCDVDELRTGMRREGMFNAMFAWTIKAGIAGTLILSGFMLKMTGYTSSAIFRFQEVEITESMRMLYMIAPAIAAALSIIIIIRTPISHAQMEKVRFQLDQRNKIDGN
jgi:Na+/melibiose symporter-like transporter